MAARAPGEFLPMFAEIKSGYDLRGSARQAALDGLVCKQGFYKGCAVLKLQSVLDQRPDASSRKQDWYRFFGMD